MITLYLIRVVQTIQIWIASDRCSPKGDDFILKEEENIILYNLAGL